MLFSVISANYKLGNYRQFLCAKSECLFSYLERNTFCLYQDSARSNRSNESLRCTLTFTHTNLCRFFGKWFIGENTNPNLSLTFHITNNSLTGSLYLLTCKPARLCCLDPERSKRELIPSLCDPLHTAFLLPSEFGFFRL